MRCCILILALIIVCYNPIAQEQKNNKAQNKKDEFNEWLKAQQDPDESELRSIARSLRKLIEENQKLREENSKLQKQIYKTLQVQNELLSLLKETHEKNNQELQQINHSLFAIAEEQRSDNDLSKWEYHVLFNLRGDRREIVIDGRSHYFFFLTPGETGQKEFEFYRQTGWQLHQIIDISRTGTITATFRRKIPYIPEKSE